MEDLTNLWMQTHSGLRFYPLRPEPDKVIAADVAHALAHICRYGGHTRSHYSVAEHCVLMSRWVPEEHALWALLHDATEAYVGDMIRPLKRQMPEYVRAEAAVMVAIADRFGLESYEMPDAVREADNRIILDERRAMMTPTQDRWAADELEPLGVAVVGWPPFTAKMEWLARLQELAPDHGPLFS